MNEKNIIKIPFDIKTAKRIAKGNLEGRVITRNGRPVRVVCFDMNPTEKYPILALIKDENGYERDMKFNSQGYTNFNGLETKHDLFIELPEYCTFKSGDFVTMGWESENEKGVWISVLKGDILYKHNNFTSNDFVSYILDSTFDDRHTLSFGDQSNNAVWVRKSNNEEITILFEELSKSEDPRAKVCLKRFFNSEFAPILSNLEKIGKNFKLFDKVLVRTGDGDTWIPQFFGRKTGDPEKPFSAINGTYWQCCIPYEGNENLAYTFKNPDDQ